MKLVIVISVWGLIFAALLLTGCVSTGKTYTEVETDTSCGRAFFGGINCKSVSRPVTRKETRVDNRVWWWLLYPVTVPICFVQNATEENSSCFYDNFVSSKNR